MRAALEGEVTFCPSGPLIYTLPLVHLWVHLAGAHLKAWTQNAGGEQRTKGGQLWLARLAKDEHADRWQFWRKRCQELSTDAELAADTRSHAQVMAKTMDTL